MSATDLNRLHHWLLDEWDAAEAERDTERENRARRLLNLLRLPYVRKVTHSQARPE